MLFLLFVALMFFVSLMFLFGYHCWLVAKNRSTLGEEDFTSFCTEFLDFHISFHCVSARRLKVIVVYRLHDLWLADVIYVLNYYFFVDCLTSMNDKLFSRGVFCTSVSERA